MSYGHPDIIRTSIPTYSTPANIPTGRWVVIAIQRKVGSLLRWVDWEIDEDMIIKARDAGQIITAHRRHPDGEYQLLARRLTDAQRPKKENRTLGRGRVGVFREFDPKVYS